VRFFGRDGAVKGSTDVLELIEQTEVAQLGGEYSDIFAVTSNEEHAYNVQTEIGMLPENGPPKRLLEISGEFGGFVGEGSARGVRISRQTYDGVNAKTKGTVQEVYAWRSETNSLRRQIR